MSPTAAKTPPRSAAARRAAGEGPHPADAPQERQPAGPPDDASDAAAAREEVAEQARADAASAAVLAGETADAAGEPAFEPEPPAAPAPEPSAVPEPSAAARRAAGDTSTPAVTAGEETVASQRPAPGPAAAPLRHVVPGGSGDEAVSAEEMAMLRRYRKGRAEEIQEALLNAPLRVGTDLDPYTLVHLRGCPDPERTETYPAHNSSTKQDFTVHRCIECGAHLAIPH